ncbi:Protein kinase-like domain containing protein [Rhypophila decipiens]
MYYYGDSPPPPRRDPRPPARPPATGFRGADLTPGPFGPHPRRTSFGHAPRPEFAPRPEPPRELRPSFGVAPRPEPPREPPRERRTSFGHAPRPEPPRKRRDSHGQEGQHSRRNSLTQTLKDMFLGNRESKPRASSHAREHKKEPPRRAASHGRDHGRAASHGREHGRAPSHGREPRREKERDVPRPPISRHGRPPRPAPPPEPRHQEPPRPAPRRSSPSITLEAVDGSFAHKTEGLKRYQVGGNCPTHIGDRLGPNGRYRVMNKLGNGSYGIAWLVEDTKDRKKPWKALKINDAGPGGESEVRLQKLFEKMGYTGQKALDNQVCVPYELFWIKSINGEHLCTVLPICGPTLEKIANDKRTEISRRALCHQVILACHFLHSVMEIMHGDFRCGNIMLQIDGLQDLNKTEIMEVYGGNPRVIMFENLPNPGISSRSAPKYLVLNAKLRMEKLTSFVKRKTGIKVVSNSRPKVAVADLGSSKHKSWPKPWPHVIPSFMTDPHVFMGGSAGSASDIWSMGVMFFEIMTGGHIFKRGDKKHLKAWEDYFPCIEECIGPLPVEYRKEFLRHRCEASLEAFPRGIPSNFTLSMDPKKCVVWSDEQHEALRKQTLGGMKAKNTPHGLLLYSEGIDAKDGDLLWRLIEACCQWRPEDRATASEIVNHKYFRAWSSTFKRDTGRGDRSCYVQ